MYIRLFIFPFSPFYSTSALAQPFLRARILISTFSAVPDENEKLSRDWKKCNSAVTVPACPVPRVSFQNSAGPLVNIRRDRFFSSNLPSRNGDVFVIFFFRPENSLRVINERKSKHEQNPILKLGCEHFFGYNVSTNDRNRTKRKKKNRRNFQAAFVSRIRIRKRATHSSLHSAIN